MNRTDSGAALNFLVSEATRPAEPESILQVRGHVCAFFHSVDEEYQVLLPFMKQGFDSGDGNLHFVHETHRDNHVYRLTSAGIDVSAAERRGQFALLSTGDFCSLDGGFDALRKAGLVQQALEDGKRQGFPITRIVGRFTAEDRPDDDTWIEFEARLSLVLRAYRAPVVCTYNLADASGAFIVDVMRTHPLVIVGGTLYENPFYVAAGEFLRQRRERIARDRGRCDSAIA